MRVCFVLLEVIQKHTGKYAEIHIKCYVHIYRGLVQNLKVLYEDIGKCDMQSKAINGQQDQKSALCKSISSVSNICVFINKNKTKHEIALFPLGVILMRPAPIYYLRVKENMSVAMRFKSEGFFLSFTTSYSRQNVSVYFERVLS